MIYMNRILCFSFNVCKKKIFYSGYVLGITEKIKTVNIVKDINFVEEARDVITLQASYNEMDNPALGRTCINHVLYIILIFL